MNEQVRQRDLNMEKFQISTFAYRELKYFCLQYEEKRAKAANTTNLSSTTYDGMPHGSSVGNPTEQKALVVAQLRGDCDMIEQSANLAAAHGCYQQLMKNVTLGVPYHCLDIPCGKNQFTNMRRHFFFLLARKKGLV